MVYIDHYGNIVSDITEEALKEFGTRDICVAIAGREIHGLVGTYSDVEPQEFAALLGSPWKLEIAQRESNAAEALGVFVGDELVVRRARQE